ncbi:MAG: DUF3187 family protein [Bdellovibrio sp.]|nr:MAG: DUF3187 family protein [Bdellovibrio sp.]
MKQLRTAFWVLGIIFFFCGEVHAFTSYRLPNPLGWMHFLPAGEAPGWQKPFWVQLEMGHANIWNAPIDLQNNTNGDLYSYFADFETSYSVLEMGFALFPSLSLSFEVPYTYMGTGFLDALIDAFHVMIGGNRYSRPNYPRDAFNFDIKTNGVDYFPENTSYFDGVNNWKIKSKWWFYQKKSYSCACGLSLSLQVKFPGRTNTNMLSSGDLDYSALLHMGFPIFKESAMWLTMGATYLGENKAFEGWPRYRVIQMYESSFDFSVDRYWGILFQVRAESPFMKREGLTIIDYSGDPYQEVVNRVSSGWNSLVNWRGSEAFGARYRTSSGSQWNFLFIEDWGAGGYDDRGDYLYVNNAPDLVFLLQYFSSF